MADRKKWTAEETLVLYENQHESFHRLAQLIPSRSEFSIRARVNFLGGRHNEAGILEQRLKDEPRKRVIGVRGMHDRSKAAVRVCLACQREFNSWDTTRNKICEGCKARW